MIWSYSNSKVFKKCQRQWYFKQCVANHKSKIPVKREAFLLSKLNTVWAWRGKLVDSIITTAVIPALGHGQQLDLKHLLRRARILFDKQLAFACAKRLREPGLAISKLGDEFAALYDVEYGAGVKQSDIDSAWSDVEAALTNLVQMTELLTLLRGAGYLVAQRALQYECTLFPPGTVSVRAVPDLIAFFAKDAPLIVDWKVHSTASADYRLQLASYAIALTRCKPHKDFPSYLSNYSPTDLRLTEVQLLSNRCRNYCLDDQDISMTDTYVADSASAILMVTGDDKAARSANVFLTARSATTCERCVFRAICWEDVR